LLIVSAMGSNAGSSNFYQKLKGEMERDALDIKSSGTYFFKPSLLLGNRNEKRFGEKIAQFLFFFLNPFFVGPLKKYKAIQANTVAKAMIHVANKGYASAFIENDLIFELADD
ncbi:MAG: nucleoside-diphosphate sugar epimerase, partial [Bacteroidota bacterium]|nr:nucleoside-diphosphate sugar epimerase [Bacteroidota bacterium]MDX5430270.1 nucleoside-diphosphate sugar epimerase [Bacteroidota bacterium]MDX5469031.1 nucleoside-diphosphate sugar epimerase [Bacteroidota bacterium]